MSAPTQPLHLPLVSVSGWLGHRQHEIIDYLVEENRVLKEQVGGRRLRLIDDQRRRLAAKGKLIGRRALNRVTTIVTPDTIMRWHRRSPTWTSSSAGCRSTAPAVLSSPIPGRPGSQPASA